VRKLLNPLFLSRMLVFLFTAVICFHLLVLAGVVPSDIVWGGRILQRGELLRFEAVSIALNAGMAALAAAYAGWIPNRLSPRFFRTFFWILFFLFSLNTAGNLAARHSLETLLFTPLTALLALVSLRLARAASSAAGNTSAAGK